MLNFNDIEDKGKRRVKEEKKFVLYLEALRDLVQHTDVKRSTLTNVKS